MKSLTIGRDISCEIRLSDSIAEISRRHAILTINGSKMTITDTSRNGTYINGIRITQGVPVPVTRKDVVSLAHAYTLDWEAIPHVSVLTQRNILYSVVAVAVLLLATFAVKCVNWGDKGGGDGGYQSGPSPFPVARVDSAEIKRQQEEQKKRDSIFMKRLEELQPQAPKKKPEKEDSTRHGKKKKDINQKQDSVQTQICPF